MARHNPTARPHCAAQPCSTALQHITTLQHSPMAWHNPTAWPHITAQPYSTAPQHGRTLWHSPTAWDNPIAQPHTMAQPYGTAPQNGTTLYHSPTAQHNPTARPHSMAQPYSTAPQHSTSPPAWPHSTAQPLATPVPPPHPTIHTPTPRALWEYPYGAVGDTAPAAGASRARGARRRLPPPRARSHWHLPPQLSPPTRHGAGNAARMATAALGRAQHSAAWGGAGGWRGGGRCWRDAALIFYSWGGGEQPRCPPCARPVPGDVLLGAVS